MFALSTSRAQWEGHRGSSRCAFHNCLLLSYNKLSIHTHTCNKSVNSERNILIYEKKLAILLKFPWRYLLKHKLCVKRKSSCWVVLKGYLQLLVEEWMHTSVAINNYDIMPSCCNIKGKLNIQILMKRKHIFVFYFIVMCLNIQHFGLYSALSLGTFFC